MLILTATTDKIQAVLGGSVTTNQLQCVSSWRDITTTTYTPGRTLINTNNTTDVDIVGAPGSSTQRVVDHINIYNNDTVAAVVTVKYDANSTEYILWKGTLGPTQKVTYSEGAGWNVIWTKIRPLFDHYTDATTTGTSEQTLYTYTLPANTLANNGDKVSFEYTVSMINATNEKFIRLTFGGTNIFSEELSGYLNTVIFKGFLIRVSNSTVRASVNCNVNGVSAITAYTQNTSLNLSSTGYALALLATTSDAAGDITARMGSGMFIPAA
jgi:hypothetical protein